MKATVLVDNIPHGDLQAEWGLSIFIEYNEKNILLDFGSTELMFENAKALGIDIKSADIAVLSHSHFDHSGGMARFFEENQKATLFVKSLCENCHAKKPFKKKRYNGVPKGVLSENKSRIETVSGKTEIAKGIYLLDHSEKDLYKKGKKSHLYREENGRLVPDDFFHEQSLIFETENGLVIFNSCCHSGADLVIKEAQKAFPNKKIKALIGGFHLFDRPKRDVIKLAQNIKATGIEFICTGHCTGEKAYNILKENLGDMCRHFHTGLILEF